MSWFKRKKEPEENKISAQSLTCPGCPRPCPERGPRGRDGTPGPDGSDWCNRSNGPGRWSNMGPDRSNRFNSRPTNRSNGPGSVVQQVQQRPTRLLRQYMHNTEIAVTMRLSTILKTIKQPL